MKKIRGLAQIPLLLGLLMMAVAIPVVTKLVEQRQDARKGAAGGANCSCQATQKVQTGMDECRDWADKCFLCKLGGCNSFRSRIIDGKCFQEWFTCGDSKPMCWCTNEATCVASCGAGAWKGDSPSVCKESGDRCCVCSGTGGETVPKTSFYGVVSDGVKPWVNGDDCNKAKGVAITSTGGSLLWYSDHFEVVNKSLTPGTVTLTPPTKCGYVCDRWEVIDKRDGITKKRGTGCAADFTPLDEDKSHVTFFIKKADVTVAPSVAPTACPTISAPSGLACNVPGNSISWNAVTGAHHYALRVDANPTSWSGTCSSVNPGDFCGDVNVSSKSYNFVRGVNHTVWVAAVNSCNSWSSATYLSCPGPPGPTGVGTTTPVAVGTTTPVAVGTTAPGPTTAPVYRACNDPCNGTSVLCLGGNTCTLTGVGTGNKCRNPSCSSRENCICVVNTPVLTSTPVTGNTVRPTNPPAVKVGCYDGRTCGTVEKVCELDDAEKWRSTYFEGEFGQIERSNWAGDFNCDGRVEIDDWTFFWGEYFKIL